jgi:Skp family chaperone for outer membrane proteins
MKFPQVIYLTFFFAPIMTARAEPNFALVKVRQIYDQLPSTAVLEQEISADRNNIMKDQRAERLRTMINDLQVMQVQLTDTKKPLDQDTNRKVTRNYEIKRMEAQNIKQEFEVFRAEQEKKINQKLVTSMKASLARILETSQTVAKGHGIELLFDSTGSTNTGVGFILYSKDSPDLTEEVKTELMKAEPPMPVKKTESSPASEPSVAASNSTPNQ